MVLPPQVQSMLRPKPLLPSTTCATEARFNKMNVRAGTPKNGTKTLLPQRPVLVNQNTSPRRLLGQDMAVPLVKSLLRLSVLLSGTLKPMYSIRIAGS